MAESEEARHLSMAGEFDCLPEPLPTLRHSTSHVMAQAVKRLFPEVKVAIGPAIEDGFYYDFLKEQPFSPEDLARIEDRSESQVWASEVRRTPEVALASLHRQIKRLTRAGRLKA